MKGINLNVKNKIIKDIGRSMGGAGKYIRTTNISKGGVCRMKFLATRHTVQQSLIIIIQKETIPVPYMYGVLRLQKETRPDLTNLHFFEAVQKEARGVKILMIAAIIANKKTKKLRLVLLVRYEVSCSTVFYLYDNGIHKLFFERSEVETKSNLQEKKEGAPGG